MDEEALERNLAEKKKIVAISIVLSRQLFAAVNVVPPYIHLSYKFSYKDELLKIAPPRIENYIEHTIPQFSRKQFQRHFRVERECFEQLLPLVHSVIKKNSALGRPAIDTEKQLLSVLWLLATPDSYRSVGERFNMANSCLSGSFFRIVEALNHLARTVISWPNLQQRQVIKEKLYHCAGVNHVVGAVDGTFIPIKAPNFHPEVYVTRKCHYAVILQGVCEGDLKFIDIFVGYPGSVSDTRMFRNSDLYSAIVQNKENYLTDEEFIIGDKAYPVLSWCLPPYINRGNLTIGQRNFNAKISRTRQVIERSFALLFGRFRRLKFLDMNRFEWIPNTVLACCVLHNLCIDYGDLHIEEYIQEGLPFVIENQNEHEEYGDFNRNIGNADQRQGIAKRDQLCRELLR